MVRAQGNTLIVRLFMQTKLLILLKQMYPVSTYHFSSSILNNYFSNYNLPSMWPHYVQGSHGQVCGLRTLRQMALFKHFIALCLIGRSFIFTVTRCLSVPHSIVSITCSETNTQLHIFCLN